MIQPGASLIRMIFSLGLLGTLAAICYLLLLPYQAVRRLRSARRQVTTAPQATTPHHQVATPAPAT